MKVLTLIEAVTDALRTEMSADRSVVVFGEDVGLEGGVFRATVGSAEGVRRGDGVSTRRSPRRASSGAAVGMAVVGLRPVVEIQFSGFVFPALQPDRQPRVAHQEPDPRRALRAHGHPHALRRRHPGARASLGERGGVFGHIPGLKVVIPSTPHDAKGLLIAAIRDPDPVIYLEPARAYRAVRQEVPEEAYTVEIGTARVEAEGDELTLVSYGAQMIEARQARAALAAEGTRWS